MHRDDPLSIERKDGKADGIQIFSITGPLTLRNLFTFQSDLRRGEMPKVSILDLAGVPYMDSAGMGAVVNYYTHCENRGVRLFVVGVSSRVLELFKLTRVHTVIPMAPTIEDVEAVL
jgi:anti-sigma B factor antagonist